MSATTSPETTQPSPTPPLPAPTTRPGLSRLRTSFVFATPFLLVSYMLIAGNLVFSGARHEQKKPEIHPAQAMAEPDGVKLYLENCSRCHGETGRADGITSEHLDPWARKFGEERFQLSTTNNGIPCDEDLHHIIQNGIPGTAMPAFDHLTEAQRSAIIQHVRRLTWAGMYHRFYKRAEEDDDVDIPRIVKNVERQIHPGEKVKYPTDLPPKSAESLARGEKIFGANCATCHGPKGAGDGPQVKGMKNDNGQPTAPRDLARGVYKGGGGHERLYLRLALGMPGTPMPASSTLAPKEIGDLVNFVQSLVKPTPNP